MSITELHRARWLRACAAHLGLPPDACLRIGLSHFATTVLDELEAEHGPLVLHQNRAYGNGFAPVARRCDAVFASAGESLLMLADKVPLLLSRELAHYLSPRRFTLDLDPGAGPSAGLESSLGMRFVLIPGRSGALAHG